MKNVFVDRFLNFKLVLILLAMLLVSTAAFANTHSSTITVTPSVVSAGSNISFNAHVECTAGPDPIHEVRIYEHFDFSNINCLPATNWYGPFPGENQYGEFCLWTAKAGHELDQGESKDFKFTADTPETECCRTWLMETRDLANYWIFNYPDICIDTTPPLTTKTFDGPQHVDPETGWEYIDGITKVVLTARDDVGPHDAGIDKTWYYNFLSCVDEPCLDPQFCVPVVGSPYPEEAGCINSGQDWCTENWQGEGYSSWEDCVEDFAHNECGIDSGWKLYRGPFTKEESCHILHYFSVDNVGNVEDMKLNCFFVDKTPPVVNKTHGTPLVPDQGFDWVTKNTDITFTCDDQGPHPSDNEELCFKVSFDEDPDGYNTDQYCQKYSGTMEGDWCCLSVTLQNPLVFNFDEDSLHDLEYFCRDAVEKESQVYKQWYKVDSTPPSISKTMLGSWLGDCPPQNPGDVCYVADDGSSGVRIDVVDGGPICAVDLVECYYELWWEDDPSGPVAVGQFGEEGVDIYFTEDSTHTLYVNCIDALGNAMVEDVEEFLVDSTPPESTKEYGDPYKTLWGECTAEGVFLPEQIALMCPGIIEKKECLDLGCRWIHSPGEVTWITSLTPITITAEDEKVGVDKIFWANNLVADEACWEPDKFCHPVETPFNEEQGKTVTIYKQEESCHLLQYYSVDKLGNEELLKWQCFFVDNTPPEGIKTVGEPKIPCEIEEPYCDGTPELDGCSGYSQEQCDAIPSCNWVIGQGYDVCEGAPDPEACLAYDETQCPLFSGCEWCFETQQCCGTPFLTCAQIQEQGVGHDYPDKCTETDGCYWQHYPGDEWCEGTPDSCEAVAANWPSDPEGKCDETPGCEWVDPGYFGVGVKAGINSVGDEIHTIFFPEGGQLGVGVAFDGEFLYYTYINSTNLYKIRPDGTGHAVVPTTGIAEPGLGALSYDATRGMLWAGTYGCSNGGPVYLIDPATGVATYKFTVPPQYTPICLCDGIAFDATDDSIWYSDDVQPTMVHLATDGTVLGTVNLTAIHPQLATNSGIAIGGDNFYLGTNGSETTIRVDKGSLTVLDTFVNTNYRIEDMECDPDTYSPIEVMWIRDAYNGSARAYEIEPQTCGFGGKPPEPPVSDCWWVRDHVTPITLDCEDQGDHPVEQETVCYKISFDDVETPWLTEEYCEEFGGTMEDGWCCVYVGDGPYEFVFREDSVHDLEFFCVDHLGNTEEETDLEWFKVDSIPPTTTKRFEPGAYVDPQTGAEFIDTAHRVILEATDGGEICAVGLDKTWYRNIVVRDEGELACWEPETYCKVPEEMEYCEDCPDGEYPYECLQRIQDWCTRNWQEEGYESWEDCVEQEAFGQCCGGWNWNLYSGPIQKEEESCHVLYYFSVDDLGNVEDIQINCFFVDKEPPVTTKWYEGPYFEEGWIEWINSDTNVWLDACDPEPHPSGVAATYYRDVYLENEEDWHYCDDNCDSWWLDPRFSDEQGDWREFTGEPFHKEEESCHIIEYYSIDNVGKEEEMNWQCVFVDNTAPTPEKIVDEPKDKWTPGENGDPESIFYPEETAHCWDGTEDEIECWEVTTATYISMDCDDPEPHPVDHERVCFKVELDGEDMTEMYCYGTRLFGECEPGDLECFGHPGYGGEMEDGWCCSDHIIEDFMFWEESEHNLKYYCEDALGNSNKDDVDEEKFKVEGTKFQIDLYKKWNLISVPFVLLNDDPEEVFEEVDENVEAVWTYKEDGNWYVYHPDSPGTSNLDSIDPGYGYWVLMNNYALLTIGGSLIGTGAPILPPSRALSSGWNLVGYYGTSWSLYKFVGLMDDWDYKCGDYFGYPPLDRWVYGDKAYCALSSLVDTQQGYPKWDSLWSFLNCGDEGQHSFWVGHNACPEGISGEFNRMYAGRGYWLHIDEEEEYAPSTVCIWNDDQICYWAGGGIIP